MARHVVVHLGVIRDEKGGCAFGAHEKVGKQLEPGVVSILDHALAS